MRRLPTHAPAFTAYPRSVGDGNLLIDSSQVSEAKKVEWIVDTPKVAAPSSRPIETQWIHVIEDMPKLGELVHVMLKSSSEVRCASRGNYQSTSAWFDAETRGPIYQTIDHWKPRSDSSLSHTASSLAA